MVWIRLKNIAKRLNVDYEEENNEVCMNIPEDVGTGNINAISFSHGVGVLNLDVRLKKGGSV